MLVWLISAALTGVVVWALLRPLRSAAPSQLPETAADIAVYRDQLSEVDRDRERGLIGAAEAEAARAEIARRLLARAAADDRLARQVAEPRSSRWPLRLVAGGVPAFAALAYLAIGSPHLPGRPHAPRQAVAPGEVAPEELLARVEARLRAAPEDGQGWDVIAPVYLRLGRYEDARQAYARALRLLGETPKRLAGFAESSVLASNGIVGEEARAAYEKIARAEPGRPEPRFWLALAKEQDGKLAEAEAEYRALMATAPADAAWRPAVEERLRIVAARRSVGDKGSVTTPGADAMAAAASLPEADRARMIAGMVEGLAKRLETDSRDLAGWQRLLRAYSVLGDGAKAAAALARARAVFKDDAKARAELDAFAASLGIKS
jgi:cytochrome c-type biogenesis protein CcmH